MDLPWVLNPDEARVLGALMEKAVTTPEYYPLSLNALVNACNQKSNREPVTSLDEDRVRLALRNLQEKHLASGTADGRVPKFQHQFQEVFNLTRGQTAIVCLLLLRGPQTPGELRGRSDRLHRFAELDEVQAALRQLMQHDPPLLTVLPRQPGTKEVRFAHLLSGAPPEKEDKEDKEENALGPPAHGPEPSGASSLNKRIERLEAAIEHLQTQIEDLRRRPAADI